MAYVLLKLTGLCLSLVLSSGFVLHHTCRLRFHSPNKLHESSGNNNENQDLDQIYYDDFEDTELSPSAHKDPSFSSSNISEGSFLESLQKRRQQTTERSEALLKNWKLGIAKSYGAFTINESFYQQQNGPSTSQVEELPFDWVRRIDMGRFPLVVCGSAYGSIYVADVEKKQIVVEARNVHSSDALDDKLRQLIYGDYDGGGVLSVAMHENKIVASSGREGGVKLFKLEVKDGKSELKYVGEVPGVRPTLITSLKFDSFGRLFLGGEDGLLRMATFPETLNGTLNDNAVEVTILSTTSSMKQQTPSPILSLDISDELDMVATAHSNGNSCLHSVDDDGNKDSLIGS